MREPVERLYSGLDYRFSDKRLLEGALTHRSAGGANNERLEFLGDAILDFVVAEELCQRFPQANEGELSRLRAALVKKDTLAKQARTLELGKYLELGSGELRSGGQSRDSILADALEAVFAAVYLDGGFDRARSVVLKLFSQRLAKLSLESLRKDPKTQLQELLQANKRPLPAYQIIDTAGSEHDQRFRVSCVLPDSGEVSHGEGASRRRAEQDAASQMLSKLPHA